MKIISCFVMLTVLSISLMAESNISVGSQITGATIFFRGAEVTHQAAVKLVKGENTVIINSLGADLDASSIKVKTTNGGMVTSFEFLHNTGMEKTSEQKRLEESLEKYTNQLLQIETDMKINEDLLVILQKGIEKNATGGEKGAGIEELMKTLEYYKSKALELEGNLGRSRKQKEEVGKSVDRLRLQIDSLSQMYSRRGALRVLVAAPADITSDITVTYYTQQAGWVPYHDIFVSSTDKPVKITSKAQVRQTTGISWEKVKLTLSTSIPNTGNNAPLFSAWFLRPYSPPVYSRGGAMMQNKHSYTSRKKVYEESIAMFDDEEDLFDQFISFSENQLNMTYEIDIPYTVSGDGKIQNIEIQNREVPALFKYYCAPKLDPETYLIAEIKEWEKLNLLSGKVGINLEGTYVGESYIDANSTNELLTLTMGHDKRVSVRREKMAEYSSSKFLGNDIRQEFTYQLTVRNNQNKAVKMVLKDQYPISTQKEIAVELLKETTAPSFNLEELGVLTWEFDMKAGETKTFRLSYSVKYPKNMQLNL